MIQIKFQEGLTGATNELEKEANLLAGDVISNFKTVQSFSNEDLLFARYKVLMEPINKLTTT